MVRSSELTLVIGGASSGKSLLAEKLAAGADQVTYVATARPIDLEMKSKIDVHRDRRPAHWHTVEAHAPDLDDILLRTKTEMLIVDGLTLYTAASMSAAEDPDAHMLDVVAALRRSQGCVIVVSDEVGSGVVPESPAGRAFRQLLGRVNQHLAATADNVYFVAAGLPLTLKGREIKGEGRWV